MNPSRSRATPDRTIAALSAVRSALLPLVSRPGSDAPGVPASSASQPGVERRTEPPEHERRDRRGVATLPALLLVALLPLGSACAAERPGADATAAASLDAASNGDRGDRWATASASGSGEIQVLYVPAEGFADHAPDGEPRGVTADLMREFAAWVEAEEGVAVRIRWEEERDWSRFYARVRDGSGGVFGIGNVTITEARRDELRFSPSYLSNVAVLITHRDVPELASLDAIPQRFAGLAALAFGGTCTRTACDRSASATSPMPRSAWRRPTTRSWMPSPRAATSRMWTATTFTAPRNRARPYAGTRRATTRGKSSA